jgi:hypothetical protein
MADPVVGIGRLFAGEPAAGEIRGDRDLGRREPDAPQVRAELGEDRLEHSGVRGDVDLHAL